MALPLLSHARIAGVRKTPASLDTHVMRYCDPATGCGFRAVPCKGHREQVIPGTKYHDARTPPNTPREPRRQAEPLSAVERAANYDEQNYLYGRNGRQLTARQVRQVERMAERAARRS